MQQRINVSSASSFFASTTNESPIVITDISTPKNEASMIETEIENEKKKGPESEDDLLPQRARRNIPIRSPPPKSVLKAEIQSPRVSKLKTEVKSETKADIKAEIKAEIKGEIKLEIKGETSRTPLKKTQGAAITGEKKKWNPSASYSYSGERGAASKEPLSASQLPNGTPNCLEVILVCAIVYDLNDKSSSLRSSSSTSSSSLSFIIIIVYHHHHHHHYHYHHHHHHHHQHYHHRHFTLCHIVWCRLIA